jgi:hypothetical protein
VGLVVMAEIPSVWVTVRPRPGLRGGADGVSRRRFVESGTSATLRPPVRPAHRRDCRVRGPSPRPRPPTRHRGVA